MKTGNLDRFWIFAGLFLALGAGLSILVSYNERHGVQGQVHVWDLKGLDEEGIRRVIEKGFGPSDNPLYFLLFNPSGDWSAITRLLVERLGGLERNGEIPIFVFTSETRSLFWPAFHGVETVCLSRDLRESQIELVVLHRGLEPEEMEQLRSIGAGRLQLTPIFDLAFDQVGQ